MCVGVLLPCIYMHHVHAWYPQRPEEGNRSLELELQTVVTVWVLGPLKEQPVLLATELTLQPPLLILIKVSDRL